MTVSDISAYGPGEDATLAEARSWLREQVNKGATCPCCKRFAKVYKRVLPPASGEVLIALYQAGALDGVYRFLPELIAESVSSRTAQQGGYGTLSHHWDLIRAQPGDRDDGSTRTGWWTVTEKGVAFVEGRETVPKYAILYGGRCLDLEGPQFTIAQCLGEHFDYGELMSMAIPTGVSI